jgi:hypothetical protein
MTISRDERVADLADTLRKMTEDVGESAVWRVDISVDSERYRQVRATTWKELLDRGLIKWFCRDTYQLTEFGWGKGIQLLELDKDPVFRGKLSKLSATLKDQVKGRHEEGYLDVYHAAQLSGLPEDLIFNIIESRILEHSFNMNGARLDSDNTIVIPIV